MKKEINAFDPNASTDEDSSNSSTTSNDSNGSFGCKSSVAATGSVASLLGAIALFFKKRKKH